MLTDKKSLELIGKLHPTIRQQATDALEEACRVTPKGVHPTLTETFRSFERSDALYNQPYDGKDNDGDGKIDEGDEKVSTVKGGGSLHNYGLAMDFVLIVDGKTSWNVDKNWIKVAEVFEKHGFSWGGRWKSFKDYPHVENRKGHSTASLLAKYKGGSTFIDANGIKYVNL